MDGDLLRRVEQLEKRVDTLEEKVDNGSIADVQTKADIKALGNEFNNLKTEVLSTIRDHTDRTWKLIDKMVKVIIFLVASVLLVAGIKLVPELFKLL